MGLGLKWRFGSGSFRDEEAGISSCHWICSLASIGLKGPFRFVHRPRWCRLPDEDEEELDDEEAGVELFEFIVGGVFFPETASPAKRGEDFAEESC